MTPEKKQIWRNVVNESCAKMMAASEVLSTSTRQGLSEAFHYLIECNASTCQGLFEAFRYLIEHKVLSTSTRQGLFEAFHYLIECNASNFDISLNIIVFRNNHNLIDLCGMYNRCVGYLSSLSLYAVNVI